MNKPSPSRLLNLKHMNITDHVFEESKIAGQSRCVADTLTQGLPLSTKDRG